MHPRSLATEQVCAAARVPSRSLQATLRKFGSAEDGVLPARVHLVALRREGDSEGAVRRLRAPRHLRSARSRFATSSPAPALEISKRSTQRRSSSRSVFCEARLRLVIELLPRRRYQGPMRRLVIFSSRRRSTETGRVLGRAVRAAPPAPPRRRSVEAAGADGSRKGPRCLRRRPLVRGLRRASPAGGSRLPRGPGVPRRREGLEP